MYEEVVEPQEEIVEEIVENQVDESVPEKAEETQQEEKKVPLSALQKERKKRQEAEYRLEWERQQRQSPAVKPEEDNSKYETATKEDLTKSQESTIREVDERIWIRNNPEKYEQINEHLSTFLKQRPNLAVAIESAKNRYEEAYILMDALTPKQKQIIKNAEKKTQAPGSPSAIPKSASLNQAVDVMQMSDSEFVTWRNSKRKRR